MKNFKTILSLLAVVFLCSACGTQLGDGYYTKNQVVTSEVAQLALKDGSWGSEGTWTTTPDGYPVW